MLVFTVISMKNAIFCGIKRVRSMYDPVLILNIENFIGSITNNKIIGIVLIIVGVVLAIWGYNIYDSAGSQIGRALSGDTPIEAWAGMDGCAICLAIGIFKVK